LRPSNRGHMIEPIYHADDRRHMKITNSGISSMLFSQNTSSESSSSSRIVCPSKLSSLRLPTSFSNHSTYFWSIEASPLHFPCSPLMVELRQAFSSFFCSLAARTEATDRRGLSSGVGVNLKRGMRTLEHMWRIEPVIRPMTAATPR